MENLYTIEDYLLKVNNLISEFEYIQAKRLLEEVLEDEPGNYQAHNWIGWIYDNQLFEFEMAERHYKLSIKFGPQYPFSYRNLIWLMSYMGRFAEVVFWVDKVTKVTGVQKEYFLWEKATALEILKDYKAAKKTYKEVIDNTLNQGLVSGAKIAIKRTKKKLTKKTKVEIYVKTIGYDYEGFTIV